MIQLFLHYVESEAGKAKIKKYKVYYHQPTLRYLSNLMHNTWGNLREVSNADFARFSYFKGEKN